MVEFTVNFIARPTPTRRHALAPATVLLMASPCAAHASAAQSVHQDVWSLGGWGLSALLLAGVIFHMLAGPARAQSSRGGDGWMDARTLAQALVGDGAPVLIDVREPDEFVGPLGHIKGAINTPLASVSANPAQLAPYRDSLIALVCRTDRRASAAAFALRVSGFKNVVVVRGGMTQWNADGLPVER